MKYIKLGELCCKIGSGATPTGGANAYKAEGISLIRSQNVLDYAFSKDGLAFIDEEQAEKLNNVTLMKNDILLNITGDSVARCCKVPDEILPARVNQHVCIVRTNNKITQNFVFYYFQFIKPLLLQMASSGATRNALTKDMIMNLEIPCLNDDDMKKITSILECISNKILLNNKLKENLGQLLQRIYDISFNKLENLGKVYDLGYVQGGYAFKSKSLLDVKTDYKIIKIKNISENSVDMLNTQYISKDVFDSTNRKFILDEGEVVVAMTGAELGKTGIVTNDEWITLLNQRVGVVRSESSINKHYLSAVFLSKAFQQKLNDMGYGSAQPNISSSDMENTEIIVPQEKLLNEFFYRTKDIYQRQIEIEKENRKLTFLRDTLLPKLMSGEIDLENIELDI